MNQSSQVPNIRIPADELWEYRECFDWFDRTGSRYIRGADLPNALRALRQYWTFEELKHLTQEFGDTSRITYAEFLEICSRKYGIVPDESALETAFKIFDREQLGQVYLDDVMHILTSIGEKLTNREFEELCGLSGIRYVGGSQTVDLNEFKAIFGAAARSPQSLIGLENREVSGKTFGRPPQQAAGHVPREPSVRQFSRRN